LRNFSFGRVLAPTEEGALFNFIASFYRPIGRCSGYLQFQMGGGLRAARAFNSPSYSYLKNLMETHYKTNNLVNVDPKTFKERIDEFQKKLDWGHNHDFGDFYLKGTMADRHLAVIATFIDSFKAFSPDSLRGKSVLDIGCWTGGMSLLLNVMGANVTAIEERADAIDCVRFMIHAFNLTNFEALPLSLYDLTAPSFQDRFDFILFAGVLYHVTDLIMALRITFNCLKDGGKCLLESAITDSDKPILAYWGPSILHRYNWFKPSPSAIRQMMIDVGYDEVDVQKARDLRAFAVGKRIAHKKMLRTGLSFRNIR